MTADQPHPQEYVILPSELVEEIKTFLRSGHNIREQAKKEERERVLKELFPKSHSGESGWRYDLKFLSHLEFKIEERNEYHFQCEDIEEILTVLEESLRAGDE